MARALMTTEIKRVRDMAEAGMTAPAIAREFKKGTAPGWRRKAP
jgi:hypothetical protein